jgi:transposase
MDERGAAVLTKLSDDPLVLKRVIAELAARVEQLEHQLGVLRRAHFGSTSERLSSPDQLSLLGKPQAYPAELPAAAPPQAKPTPPGHGRSPLPPHLKRILRTVDVPEDNKRCPDCGKVRARIGADTAEQIEYTPATLVVIRTERPKYACRDCQEGVVVAEPPPAPIEKGLPGPGMLAYVAVAKYDDHLPLYRQQEIFRRQGVEIARSTLCDWVKATSELLDPVVDAMMQDLLASKVIQTDDIPVPVQESPHTREGRLWVYLGDRSHPHIVYRFSPNRQQQWAQEHLKPYHGYVQADAYTGYDKLFEDPTRIEVGCWAHARRKFFDAQGSDAVRSAAALQYIRELYRVEEDTKELAAPERQALRHERSRPVLEALRAWMTAEELSILPKSPLGEAFTYARNQWAALNRYVEDGDLAIDNNASERALRGVAVGRKNWLFAGSDDGGRRAAVLYSLIESAKRAGVEPWAYLRDLLVRIDTHPANRIAELTPFQWKPTV